MTDPIAPENRNIVDYYKYWETEAVLADLDTKRHNFSVLCCNIVGDFNIGSIVRNANAFLAKEVIFYGKNRWDRRGAVGTHNYTQFKKFKPIEDLEELKEYISDYRVIGIDNIPNSKDISDFNFNTDQHTLLVFGEEQAGIQKEILELCNSIVYIKQYGSVRSLNVGVASGIAMYSFLENQYLQGRA